MYAGNCDLVPHFLIHFFLSKQWLFDTSKYAYEKYSLSVNFAREQEKMCHSSEAAKEYCFFIQGYPDPICDTYEDTGKMYDR